MDFVAVESRCSAPVLVALGLVAGLTSGLFGVGGGVVMVPMLVLICASPQHDAHVTSLGAALPIAAVGAATYLAAESADLGVALLLAAGGIGGAQLGARILASLSGPALRISFGVVTLAVALVLNFT